MRVQNEQVKVGILSNVVSKANRSHGVHDSLDDIIRDECAERFVTHICVGRADVEDPSFEQLVELYTPAVRQLVEEKKVDILAIDGGDGTAHIVYSVLMHLYKDKKMPAVVHLRGGTINYIADSTAVPKRSPLRWIPHQLKQLLPSLAKYVPFKTEHAPEYVLRKLIHTCAGMTVKKLHAKHVQKYRLLKVDDNLENKVSPKKYGLLAAFGAPYNFLELYYDAETGKPGAYKALKIIAKGIASAVASPFYAPAWEYVHNIVRKIDATVQLDGQDLPHREYTGIVPTAKDIKLKLTPITLNVSKGIDKLYRIKDYYGIRAFGANVNIPMLLWNFAKIVLPGFNVKNTYSVHNKQVQEIVITPAARVGYSIEGNLYKTANPIRITPSETMMPFFQF